VRNFQNLIVSEARICTHYLQTAWMIQLLEDFISQAPYASLPWAPLGTSVIPSGPMGYSPPNENSWRHY